MTPPIKFILFFVLIKFSQLKKMTSKKHTMTPGPQQTDLPNTREWQVPWPSKARPRVQQTWNLGPNIFRRINTWPMKCLREVSSAKKHDIIFRLCNSIKLLQTHSKKNMLSCCLQRNQIKQTSNTKNCSCHSHPPYKNTSQRIPAPKNQLPNSTKTTAARFFGNIFRQCPVWRCRALVPPGWWSKIDNDTEILGEKHDKQWLLKMCCLVRFQKKWLTCLFSCNICHASLR